MAYVQPAYAVKPTGTSHHQTTSVQSKKLTPRDSLLKAIKAQAWHDVASGNAKQRISELNLLFGEEAKATGISMREALHFYEETYDAAFSAKPWWEKLQPNMGWILAGIVAAAAIFWNTIKDYLSRFFKWSIELFYDRLAGYKPFWMFALKRYRRHLVGSYHELKIPFRPDRPLKMEDVYVPLKVSETSDQELVDAYLTVSKYRRLMIVGTPGSGKSMLLKNIALTYAKDELTHFDDNPIPVLLELHRLNDNQKSLLDQLKLVLERNDFPHADSFIKSGLQHNNLLLLFDGLDEVNSDRRSVVVGEIKDLLDQYPECRALFTCRATVYKGEFDDTAEQKLEIVEFNDQQIQRFLNSWQADLPAEKSITHLLHTLHERPNIMALARNPLLLTIIAYLYADTAFVLPHSRAEFYDKATDVLLDQWKVERNKYKAAHKQLVLRHLALFNQDNTSQHTQDRRSIDLSTILVEIKQVLPKLNLNDEVAHPLLDEIVERSGLLISIDGGEKFQFTHLTLQEFFAAQELEGHGDQLLARFKSDPDAWRETVKLWCGLPQDSTNLIRDIYALDPITAIEALGDAMHVDNDLANDIIDTFKQRLGEDGDAGDAAIRALASVVVDPRPRGEQLFSFLTATIAGENLKKREAAASIFALSNLPKAADTLAKYAQKQPDLQAYLVQMGNLSVSALAKWAEQGKIWALDGLQSIGTPKAAKALVDIMWNGGALVPYQAAWRLAAVLPKPGVETILNEQPLTPEQHRADTLDWVWAPFEEDDSAPIRSIIGRIAYLLHTSPNNTVPSTTQPELDPRLVIPVCAVAAQATPGKLKVIKNESLKLPSKDQYKVILGIEDTEINVDEVLTDENLDKVSDDVGWRYLFGSLKRPLQYHLLSYLTDKKPALSVSDWRNIFRPIEYKFEGSLQQKGIIIALFIPILLGGLSLFEIIYYWPKIVFSGNAPSEIIGLFAAIFFLFLWNPTRKVDYRFFFDLKTQPQYLMLMSILIGPMLGYAFTNIKINLSSLAKAISATEAFIFALTLILVYNDSLIRRGKEFSISQFIYYTISGTIIGAIIGGLCALVIWRIGDRFFVITVSLILLIINSAIYKEKNIMKFWFLFIFASGYLLMYLPTMILIDYRNRQGAIAFWLVWLVVVVTLCVFAIRRERAAQNPLRGLLDLSGEINDSFFDSLFESFEKSISTISNARARMLLDLESKLKRKKF